MPTFLRASDSATMEHNDTVASYFMYPMDVLREATEGAFLQFINEMTVEPGVAIEPHLHNSHEFYYVLKGDGEMRVGDEMQRVTVGDLIHTQPNVPHSLRGGPEGIRCFCFAVSFQQPGEGHTVVEFEEWAVPA